MTQRRARVARIAAPYTWAWMLEDGSLCYWSEPTSEKLRSRAFTKPSSGAKAVRVRIMREGHYQTLVRLALKAK